MDHLIPEPTASCRIATCWYLWAPWLQPSPLGKPLPVPLPLFAALQSTFQASPFLLIIFQCLPNTRQGKFKGPALHCRSVCHCSPL